MKSINTMVCKILYLANLIYDLKSYNSANKLEDKETFRNDGNVLYFFSGPRYTYVNIFQLVHLIFIYFYVHYSLIEKMSVSTKKCSCFPKSFDLLLRTSFKLNIFTFIYCTLGHKAIFLRPQD